MKKVILTIILIVGIIGSSFAQLNSNAKQIKENAPEMYAKIKKHASKDWAGDHNMMVHVINSQSDAVMELKSLMGRSDYDKEIMGKALVDWTEDEIIDYAMVVHVYKGQLESKGQY